MDITAPAAILLASAMTISSGLISGFVVRAYTNPRKRRRIRAALFSEIREMNDLMERTNFSRAIQRVRSREWKIFPRVIDSNLPQEPTHRLLYQHMDLFSEREIGLFLEFFRRLKASRAFCLALCDTSLLQDDQVKELCDAAENEWLRVKSTAETILREASFD